MSHPLFYRDTNKHRQIASAPEGHHICLVLAAWVVIVGSVGNRRPTVVWGSVRRETASLRRGDASLPLRIAAISNVKLTLPTLPAVVK